MQLIKLSKVLEEIDRRDDQGKPIPFSIQFITADISRNKGGKRVHAAIARACTNEITQRDLNKIKKYSTGTSPKPRNTRNIMINGIDHPVPVHIRLIEYFNNQEVIY